MIRAIIARIQRFITMQDDHGKISCGTTNKQARDAWIRDVLNTIPEGCRILDAGAGEQQYRPYCRHLQYVSQDFGRYDGKGDDAGLQTQEWDHGSLDIISDISAIPEPDASFDAIMCTEVLEHLPDPVAAFREFRRLLKPGGLLILTAPFCSLTHYSPYHFFSGFNRYFFAHWLDRSGFTVVEMQPNGNYFEYLGQELLRVDSIAHRYTKKPLLKKERSAIRTLLSTLDKMSRADTQSHELLCFGYHVLARKN